MNKKDIIVKINEKLGKSQKDISIIINTFLDEISEALKNDGKVTLTNFGTFTKSKTKTFNVFSPKDGSLLTISQSRVIFRSSNNLKSYINKKQE